MKMKNFFLFDGRRVSGKQLGLASLERGFLYGDGVFETMRTCNYRIFMWDRHIERMKKGLALCNINMVANPEKLHSDIEQLLKEKHVKNAYVRLNVWRKETGSFDPKGERKSHTLAIIRKYLPCPGDFYSKGISCCVSRKFLKNELSPVTYIKSFNYLENILAREEAKNKGCSETILLNCRGELAESSVANLFFTKGKTVYTPSVECGILPGITRALVIEICKTNGLKVKEGRFKPVSLKGADEVFLTNTLMGLIPVRKIEGFFEKKRFACSSLLSGELEKVFLMHTEF